MVDMYRIRAGGLQWYTHTGSGSGMEACNGTHMQDQDCNRRHVQDQGWRSTESTKHSSLQWCTQHIHSPPPPPPAPHTVLHPLYTQCSPPPPHAKSEKKKIKAWYIQVLKAINNNKNKIKKEKNTHACCLVKISTAIYNPDCLFVTRPLNCSHCLSLINVYLNALKNSVQTPTKTKYSHTHTKETCFFVIF